MIDLKEALAGSELSYEEITKENETLIRENAVLKDLVVKLAARIEL